MLSMPLARALQAFSATYTWHGPSGRPAVRTVHFVPPHGQPGRQGLPSPVPPERVVPEPMLPGGRRR